MAQKFQAKPEKIDKKSFHHGLIKLIVMGELQRREKAWDYILFWGEFEQEIQPKGKKTPTKKSSTPKSRKRKKRALSPVQTEDPTHSSSLKEAKKKLDFDQGIEGQSSVADRNILNFPYSNSESETPMDERDETEVESLDNKIPETPGSKVGKSLNIKKLKEEILELKFLERVINSQNHTIKNKSNEARDFFKRLDNLFFFK